ncbi:MAG: hypothetical protein SNJ64_06275 [Endomicrobiia bacterium]
MNKLVSFLYTLARRMNDINSIMSLFTGKPKKFVKRVVNKQLGKHIIRRLFWK